MKRRLLRNFQESEEGRFYITIHDEETNFVQREAEAPNSSESDSGTNFLVNRYFNSIEGLVKQENSLPYNNGGQNGDEIRVVLGQNMENTRVVLPIEDNTPNGDCEYDYHHDYSVEGVKSSDSESECVSSYQVSQDRPVLTERSIFPIRNQTDLRVKLNSRHEQNLQYETVNSSTERNGNSSTQHHSNIAQDFVPDFVSVKMKPLPQYKNTKTYDKGNLQAFRPEVPRSRRERYDVLQSRKLANKGGVGNQNANKPFVRSRTPFRREKSIIRNVGTSNMNRELNERRSRGRSRSRIRFPNRERRSMSRARNRSRSKSRFNQEKSVNKTFGNKNKAYLRWNEPYGTNRNSNYYNKRGQNSFSNETYSNKKFYVKESYQSFNKNRSYFNERNTRESSFIQYSNRPYQKFNNSMSNNRRPYGKSIYSTL